MLRPGGRFAVTDIVADPDMDEATRADMQAWTGCIAGALTREEFERGCSGAGSRTLRSARPTGSTSTPARRSSAPAFRAKPLAGARTRRSVGCDAVADIDAVETEEWLEALDAVVKHDGPRRAHDLVERVVERARLKGAAIEHVGPTPYVNTIPREEEPPLPGDPAMERRVRSLIRWNAIAMILRANKESSELGGHIASYQSAALLYEIGFNHFWHAPSEDHGGDLVYIQGHSSPGIYARAFLEGRLTEEQLEGFRQEVSRPGGISSYPHPWLMPDFWQFPTVSMGLGPIMAIYQARFMRYLTDRGITDTSKRKVWCFLGDGETDEPESLGAIGLAGREKLDNLVFVVNCNLQRLDGPVHGNGKIIQVLETIFRGAGWNVIKVIWGDRWDPLLEADEDGLLVRRMEEAVDGEYQTYKARDGAFVREKFFGKYPELAERVKDMTDEEIWALNRGGHDARKVYAAYAAAQGATQRPTVILAKTIKGYGMGEAGEGQNITHQQKKMNEEALRAFRDRFELDISDEEVREVAFHKPPDDSPEITYLQERRKALGGYLPQRRQRVDEPLEVPPLETFQSQLDGTGEREISSTMAFVRILAALLRDKTIGPRVVPIVARRVAHLRDGGDVPPARHLLARRPAVRARGRRAADVLPRGPEGPGAAGGHHRGGRVLVLDRRGDLLLEPRRADGPVLTSSTRCSGSSGSATSPGRRATSRARGFLLGGTAGRTTLNGEGLQHEDGHSHVLSQTIPNCISYDPAYAYELAVIVHDGLRRMVAEQEDVFYYLTIMNENYRHPPLPEGSEEGILRGMHRIREMDGAKVRLLGSGTILREVEAAAELLGQDFEIPAEVWSVTSYTELRRDGLPASASAAARARRRRRG